MRGHSLGPQLAHPTLHAKEFQQPPRCGNLQKGQQEYEPPPAATETPLVLRCYKTRPARPPRGKVKYKSWTRAVTLEIQPGADIQTPTAPSPTCNPVLPDPCPSRGQ